MPALIDLPPWYVSALFKPPRITNPTPSGGVDTLVPADGTRYAIIIGVGPTVAGNISILPSSAVTTSFGYGVNAQNSPFVVSQELWGPTVQMQWFWTTGGVGPGITVIELSLLEWPTDTSQTLVMPWEKSDAQAAQKIADAKRRKALALCARMQRCGITPPSWLGCGVPLNANQPPIPPANSGGAAGSGLDSRLLAIPASVR